MSRAVKRFNVKWSLSLQTKLMLESFLTLPALKFSEPAIFVGVTRH